MRPVSALLMHAVVYVVVNAVLVFAWVLNTGSLDRLRHYTEAPSDAVTLSFWPVVPIVVWGAALVIHAAAVLVSRLPASRRRRRERERRRRRREYERQRARRRALRDAKRSSAEATRRAEALARQVAAGATSGEATAVPQDERPDGRVQEGNEQDGRTATTTRRRWVVVVFTDISRSTPLTEALGDEAWAEVLAEHRDTVRGAVSRHGGHEVGTQGDGFLVRFDEPSAAVDCAVELQRQLEERRVAGAFTPEVRMGIHAGEAIHDDEDLVGRVVNLASRLVDVAGPGEILVTEPVADHLDPALDLVDRGLRQLKGLARPRHLLAVAWRDPPPDDVIVLRPETEDHAQ